MHDGRVVTWQVCCAFPGGFPHVHAERRTPNAERRTDRNAYDAFCPACLLGVPPPAAASLALLSQVLIPWGALGPGTLLGAALAGVDLRAFGAWTSAASALWLLLLLPLFWRLSAEAGLAGSARERLADAATMVLLAALLVGANLVATVEIAGLVALSPPLLARLWAEQGGAEAQYALSVMLDTGAGQTRNADEALRWLRASAGQNYPPAVQALQARN